MTAATTPATDAEIEKLRKFAKEATVALTGLTAGGSEYFSGKIGDIYVADIPFCVERIRDRDRRQHEQIIASIARIHQEREKAIRECAEVARVVCDDDEDYGRASELKDAILALINKGEPV